MKRTLVLGLGNSLLADEGVGIHVVERLQERYRFPPEVQLLDGGTLGLDLLHYVEAADRLLVIDALEFGAEPGTRARLEGEQVPAFLSVKLSPHQIGLADLLAASRLRQAYPEQVVLLGVQPAVIDVGLELSPAVATEVDALAEEAVMELHQWGIIPSRKDGRTAPGSKRKVGDRLCG